MTGGSGEWTIAGTTVPVRSEVFYDQLVIESQVHLGLKT